MAKNYKRGLSKGLVIDRIKRIEDTIEKAHEYLENGSHAHWHQFRPLFTHKVRDGKILPPHKDWVKNVFIPSRKSALRKAEILLEKMDYE